MAELIVRDLDDEIITALQARAAKNGRSMEAEHREILREALGVHTRAEAFKEWLLSMPDVGRDEDFALLEDLPPVRK